MKVKKVLLVALGCVGLALGAVGAVVPLLPAFPFLMLAAFCFAKSSERLHAWFTATKLYKKNLESYVALSVCTPGSRPPSSTRRTSRATWPARAWTGPPRFA